MFNWVQLALGAALALAVATGPVYLTAYGRGDRAGYDRRVAEVAAANVKAELERKGDDAKLQGMSDFDLCVTGLRAGGLPVDACEQLRGVREE